MAVLLLRVRNDLLTFPYPKDLLAVFEDKRYQDVHTFMSKANHSRMDSWTTQLTCERSSLTVEEIVSKHPEVKVNPRLVVKAFRMPGEQ